jgi:hypothetical protein
MTNETYEKAKEIQKKIDDFRNLRYLATQGYKRFFLTKKFLWVSSYDKTSVCLCDEGLNNLIREYCDERIKELKEELKSL